MLTCVPLFKKKCSYTNGALYGMLDLDKFVASGVYEALSMKIDMLDINGLHTSL